VALQAKQNTSSTPIPAPSERGVDRSVVQRAIGPHVLPRIDKSVHTDQAAKLRSLTRRTTKAQVIAITSGKGGVGKSNVAVNLSIKLAQSGKRVILLDADLGLANADVLCNVEIRSNLAHVVARQKELAEVLVDAPGGFKLIGGASGLAKMADLTEFDRQRLVAALGELETLADHIIIDTGAGISPNVLCFTRAADHVLVVTTPEPTAITDAYAVIKVLHRSGQLESQRTNLVVNQALTQQEAAAVYSRISSVARQFLGVAVYDAGYVLRDDAVGLAVRSRVPFVIGHPRSEAAWCINQLAMRFEQNVVAIPGKDGFFDRFSRWLRSQ